MTFSQRRKKFIFHNVYQTLQKKNIFAMFIKRSKKVYILQRLIKML